MVLYVASELPPLRVTALQTLHFAVLLCGVSSVKYFWQATYIFAAQCLLAGCKLWTGFREQGVSHNSVSH